MKGQPSIEPGRVLVPIHDPGWGGVPAFALNIASRMKEEGWPWLVVLPEEADATAERLQRGGVDVVQIPLKRLRKKLSATIQTKYVHSFIPTVRRLTDIIRSREVRLVQAVGIHNLDSGLAARMAGVPLVWQIHGVVLPSIARRLLSPLAIRMADVIMTNGRMVGTKFPGVSSLGDRRFVFYAPVNYDLFKPSAEKRAQARKELEVEDDHIVVGTVGNQIPVKQHEVLLNIASKLFQQYPSLRVRILGAPIKGNEDYYKANVLKRVDVLNKTTPNFIKIINPGNAVPTLINAFDVFAITSRAEGVPLVLGEAMAAALPVISFDVGSIGEVSADDKTGYVIAAGDQDEFAHKLMKLIENPELRKRFGVAGRARVVSDFSLNAVVESHISAYKAAIILHEKK